MPPISLRETLFSLLYPWTISIRNESDIPWFFRHTFRAYSEHKQGVLRTSGYIWHGCDPAARGLE
jgi:hypothetical protein